MPWLVLPETSVHVYIVAHILPKCTKYDIDVKAKCPAVIENNIRAYFMHHSSALILHCRKSIQVYNIRNRIRDGGAGCKSDHEYQEICIAYVSANNKSYSFPYAVPNTPQGQGGLPIIWKKDCVNGQVQTLL